MKLFFYCFGISLTILACSENEHGSHKHQHDSNEDKHYHHHHGDNAANQHMHHAPVAELIETFDSPERMKTQKPEEVIDLLEPINCKTILDIGAGSGYFSFRMAERGAAVIAGDVDDEFLAHINKKNASIAKQKGSVTTRKLPFDSPALTPQEIDDAIIVNTYHHIENRISYFKQVLEGLEPGGRLMVVDFKKKHFDEEVAGPPYEMRIAASQVKDELSKAGFDNFEINHDLLPYQFVLIAWQGNANSSLHSNPMREKFQELSPDKINNKIANYRHAFTPEQIMREYYPLEVNQQEGKEKITVTSKDIDNDKVEVTLIHDNLLDDSMKGKKIVMEMSQVNQKWKVNTIKKNWKCHLNRGHQDWGIENCK